MKKALALAALIALTLSACKDDTQAKLEQQQKQIETLQQQLAAQQNQDDSVYALSASAVSDTIPSQYQANGNNGEPVTGTDGQQYIYDQSSGNWLLHSLVGAAAGAFIGNSLAHKFQKMRSNTPTAQRVRTEYYQSRPYTGKTAQAPSKLTPRQQAATNEQARRQAAMQPHYRQTQQGYSNHRRPRSNSFSFGRRRR